jgi:hypothetical protein
LTALAALWLLVAGRQASADQFWLDVPGKPSLRSTASIDARQLRVTDARGAHFLYVRRPEWDSEDSRYLCYYSAEMGRYLRWPIGGAGNMYIGERQGGTLRWKKSLMQVRPRDPIATTDPSGIDPSTPAGSASGRGAGRATTMAPLDPLGAQRDEHSQSTRAIPPAFLSVLRAQDGQFFLGHVDVESQVRIYTSDGDDWRLLDTARRADAPGMLRNDRAATASRRSTGFVPGAPLLLVESQGSRIPIAISVNSAGELVEYVHGLGTRLPRAGRWPKFPPGAYLARGKGRVEGQFHGVDREGRLWDLRWRDGTATPVDRRRGAFPPGCPVASLSHIDQQLYGVDRQGTLVCYRRADGDPWSLPQRVGNGFVPGGHVALTRFAVSSGPWDIGAASVDTTGRVLLGRSANGAWDWETVSQVRLPPGAPVGLDSPADGISLIGIDPRGRMTQWRRHTRGWSPQEIAVGFHPGAPVWIHPAGPRCFAIDRRGRPLAARWLSGRWRCAVCCPGFSFAPHLVSRSVRPNPPLTSANIEFVNHHNEELVVRIMDKRRPGKTNELRLLPDESWSYQIDRDSGGVWQEVYQVPSGFGGWVEQVQQFPLPPQVLYEIVLYANRTTSVYFDRTTNKSDVPDSVQKSLVSIGVFPIPPGDLVRDGERIDVYQEAKARGNPGAAAWFGKPE